MSPQRFHFLILKKWNFETWFLTYRPMKSFRISDMLHRTSRMMSNKSRIGNISPQRFHFHIMSKWNFETFQTCVRRYKQSDFWYIQFAANTWISRILLRIKIYNNTLHRAEAVVSQARAGECRRMQRPAAAAIQDSSALNGRSFGAFVIYGDAAVSEHGRCYGMGYSTCECIVC